MQPAVQPCLPLFVRKHPILKSFFPLSRNHIVRMSPPARFGCGPLGTDSYPGEVSRKCLFLISKLVCANYKRKVCLLLKQAKSTKYAKLKVTPHLHHQPISQLRLLFSPEAGSARPAFELEALLHALRQAASLTCSRVPCFSST